jgi:DNA-directed RNA polymerase specialized sigma24 family protein
MLAMSAGVSLPSSEAEFASTHWSVVMGAARRHGIAAAGPLAALCEAYWSPVYLFLRRKGRNAEDARDLTQGFFARLLERDVVAAADPARGRFRSFLLKAVQCYAANLDEAANAIKRGGGMPAMSLEWQRTEGTYLVEPSHRLTPERLFERRWAIALLERVLARLRRASTHGDNGLAFDRLKGFLGGPSPDDSYAAAAAELHMTEAAVKVAVHRLRGRYRELLREEIGRTVDSQEDVDDEIRHLFDALTA